MHSRVEAVQAAFDDVLAELRPVSRWRGPADPVRPGSTLLAARAVALFADMVRAREIDVAARRLRAEGHGWYTISGAGHELNGVVGAVTRPTDPAFLHYRSGAFMMARLRHDPDAEPVHDTLLSVVGAADDPVAQGRHKVWGSKAVWVPPQTSTIGSHLPKAVGTAYCLAAARRQGTADLPADTVVVCSFGDASVNHATALAGVNAARYAHRRGSRVPIVFVCEDNGLGISVETPRGWITDSFAGRSHLRYTTAEGEVDEVWDAVTAAVARCREDGTPTVVHLPTVRLWGHAGSDVETAYRTTAQIAAAERRDPLPAVARRLVDLGATDPGTLQSMVADIRAEVERACAAVRGRAPLGSRAAVTAPLAPYDAAAVRREAARPAQRPPGATAGGRPDPPTRRTLAGHLNAALDDELGRRPELLLFGEDVGRKGGVYHVTAGLQQAHGAERVFDTLLDETTVLGVAQGAGILGLLPVPEIQYLAYVHNALDQLRGEACSLSFFSGGTFTNPMVVRIPGLAYQRGFGGHFHNDNAIGALRDIPGLAIAVPARPRDGARLLRGALAMARACGRVVVLLEPIALYHEKDLLVDGDGRWLQPVGDDRSALLAGTVGVHGADVLDDPDRAATATGGLAVLTYGNGLRMALRAAAQLRDDDGAHVRVIDLRWLAPLPWQAIVAHAHDCGRVLVADECRATGGGIADAVVAGLAERGFDGPLGSVRSADSYVPLGPAAAHVLLSESDILAAARRLLARPQAPAPSTP